MPPPRSILITGATTGIGARLARDYDAAGWDVVATGTRPEGPPGATYLRADQSDPAAAAAAIGSAVGGRLDAAILNAGIGRVGDLPEPDPAAMLDVNMTATILAAHAVAPAILAAGGSLVVIGSSLHRGSALAPTYAATKAALHGFIRALSVEWRGRAHAAILHPGATDTGMLARAGLARPPPAWMLADPARVACAVEDVVARRGPSGRLGRLRLLTARGVR